MAELSELWTYVLEQTEHLTHLAERVARLERSSTPVPRSPGDGGRSRREDDFVGDWSLTNTGRWVYDPNAPSVGADATSMMPAVPKADDTIAALFEREDGSIYGRVDPAALPPFDEVDSTTIVDRSAP